MPTPSVTISSFKSRSRYLLLPLLLGLVSALASVPFMASASESTAATWSGWDALDTIVVQSPTDEFLDQAATELQDYLAQISGRAWAISYTDITGPAVRLVVDPANPSLSGRNNDSVHLLTDSSGITLTGKTSIATRHGAYILLEELGVRWLYSSDAWTIVPGSLDPLALGLDKVEEPFFVERGLGNPIGYLTKIQNGIIARDNWRARNRLDGWGDYSAKHSWYAFAPVTDVFAEDPTAVCYKTDGVTPQQVLPYHQVVIDRALAYARNWFDNDPTGRRMAVPISPADGNKIWCDEWRVDGSYHSETISNYVFELTNVVARMLQVEYPGKYASVLSYSHYSDVPSIPLEPNVYVQITNFARGDQTADERIAGFAAKGAFTGFYDYFDVWAWWKDRVPPPGKLDLFINSMGRAAKNGLDTFYAEGSNGWAPKGRLYWLTSQLLWDPTRESDLVMDEFYSMAFGPARDIMDRFYTRFDTQTHDDRVWGLAFTDLQKALDIANAAGNTKVAERIRQTILHTYFSWRWGDQVEADHTGFASIDDAKDYYTFISQIKDLYLITWRPHEEGMRPTLVNTYALTDAEVDALQAAAVPHTPANVQTLLSTALANWDGQQLVDAITVPIEGIELVPLGDDVTPALSPVKGFNYLDIIVPSSGNETIQVSIDVSNFGAIDTVRVYTPGGTLIQETSVSYDSCTCEITFNTTAPGNYRIRTSNSATSVSTARPAAVDISLGGPKVRLTSAAYFYVPAGTSGLIVSIDIDGSPVKITKSDGSTLEFSLGSTQFTNPIQGIWKVEVTTTLNSKGNRVIRNLRLVGVAPLLWHDPAQLLVPASVLGGGPTPTPEPTVLPLGDPPTPTPVPTATPAPTGGGGAVYVPPPPTPTRAPTAAPSSNTSQSIGSVPTQPRSVTTIAGDGQALLEIVGPISEGSQPITGYGVQVVPTNIQLFLDIDKPLIVTGLDNGVPVRFKVFARNDIGSSVEGTLSNIVVPQAGLVLPTATPDPANTVVPSEGTATPTTFPTATATPDNGGSPVVPTATPQPAPTATPEPTAQPTATPALTPTPEPVVQPTATPVPAPTVQPTATPEPTAVPAPTAAPTVVATATPAPTATPVVVQAPTDLDGPVVSQSIDLNAGWNLISFNIAHENTDPRRVFQSLDGLYSEVSTIVGDKSLVFRPDQPDELNELIKIELFTGYWIKVNAAATLTVHGTEMDRTVPRALELGWNLVGYLSDSPHPVTLALYSLEGKYSEVRGFDLEGASYFPDLPHRFSTLTEMEPGKGYLINVTDSRAFLFYP